MIIETRKKKYFYFLCFQIRQGSLSLSLSLTHTHRHTRTFTGCKRAPDNLFFVTVSMNGYTIKRKTKNRFLTFWINKKNVPSFKQENVSISMVFCCVFRPANRCSARRLLVKIDFLTLKKLFPSLTEQNKQYILWLKSMQKFVLGSKNWFRPANGVRGTTVFCIKCKNCKSTIKLKSHDVLIL